MATTIMTTYNHSWGNDSVATPSLMFEIVDRQWVWPESEEDDANQEWAFWQLSLSCHHLASAFVQSC